MSNMEHIKNTVKDAFISGEPGTTGREPFDDSTAAGPGQRFSSGTGASANAGVPGLGAHGTQGTPGSGLGNEHGLAGTHHNQSQHGAVDALTAGSGHAHSHSHSHEHGTGTGVPSAGYGDKTSDSLAGSGTQYGAGHHGTTGQPVGTGAGVGGLGGGMTGAHGHRDNNDRVGHVGQDSAKYEGDMHSGPRTGGAAGTDRFDSDRTGVAGGVGSGLDRQHDDGVQHDTSQRAPGKSSGGLAGVFATSDKDFTGRDRKGEGAYADTDGPYTRNETGPAGNTALTGREGNLDNNPVAQAKSRDPSSATATNEHPHGTHGAEGEHKGFIQKVKDAIL